MLQNPKKAKRATINLLFTLHLQSQDLRNKKSKKWGKHSQELICEEFEEKAHTISKDKHIFQVKSLVSLFWRNIIHLLVEDIFPYVINLQPAKGKGLSAKLADWTLIWLITKLIGLLNVRIRRVLRFFWLFPIELGVLIHVRDLPRLHPIVPSLLRHPLH